MYDQQDQQNERIELNQSKFMTEQVNWDQQPTQQEIIQKAQQLDIDDYKLAKEALVKQLDPQWRPYINRYGQIYYINLQEKKGFIDHPIDMEYKITYALKYRKKVPQFKQFTLKQISEDTRIIMRQINDYERQKGLKIVYQESDQESIRKKTLRAQEEQCEQFNEQANAEIQRQINVYKLSFEREIKKSLNEYHKMKQYEYKSRVQKHQNYILQLKKARLEDIDDTYSQQIEQKNKINYQRAIQNTMSDFQIKKIKYEDTLAREMELIQELQKQFDTKINYKRLSKQRLFNKKRRLRDQNILSVNAYKRRRVMQEIYTEEKQFNKDLELVTSSKINYQKIIDRNLQELNRQPEIKFKKRYPIFQSEADTKQKEIKSKKIQLDIVCKIEHEQVWTKRIIHDEFISKSKPSLPLRLIKRIL